ADEVAQHLCSDVEIGDDAVPKRADGANRRRCAADHPPSVLPDRVDAAGGLVDRYDGRLEDRNPLAANEYERIRRAEVDRKLAPSLETTLSHRPSLTVDAHSAVAVQ